MKSVNTVSLPSQDHRSAIAGHPARLSRRTIHPPKGSLSHPHPKLRDVNRPSSCSAICHCRYLYCPVVTSPSYRHRRSIRLDRFISSRITCWSAQLLYNLRRTLLNDSIKNSYFVISSAISDHPRCHIPLKLQHRPLDAPKALS